MCVWKVLESQSIHYITFTDILLYFGTIYIYIYPGHHAGVINRKRWFLIESERFPPHEVAGRHQQLIERCALPMNHGEQASVTPNALHGLILCIGVDTPLIPAVQADQRARRWSTDWLRNSIGSRAQQHMELVTLNCEEFSNPRNHRGISILLIIRFLIEFQAAIFSMNSMSL